MTKITPEHLARAAFVYVRQSTADQVLNNHESRRRQYALVDRARVGRCRGDRRRSRPLRLRRCPAGLREAARRHLRGPGRRCGLDRGLARNGRDWHTLLEFCGLVGTLIADEDGVYEPTPRYPYSSDNCSA